MASTWSMGFPGGSDSKESAWNAGDPGSISGSRRYPGEGNGNPFQYSCQENPMYRGTWWATVHGVQRVGHDWATNSLFHMIDGAPFSLSLKFIPLTMKDSFYFLLCSQIR